jgi:type IV pilus assembly protein PilC
MPLFEYKASDRADKIQTSFAEAASREALIDSLIEKGLYVIEIKEIQKKIKPYFSFSAGLFNKVSQKEVTYFYIQLSTLISSGVTLIESLESLIDQTQNPHFKNIINDIKTRIATGQTFFEAVSRHPQIFDDVAANMIKAGETGAGLDEVLERIAKFSERDTKIRSKVKSAMIYPLTLSAIAVSVIFFLVVYVFPKFTKVFAKSKTALPTPTVLLMKSSEFMQEYYILILASVIAAFFILRWLVNTNEKAQALFDRVALKLPVFGDVISKATIARFIRTLATLLNSGVPILKSLEVCENIVENTVLKRVVTSLKGGVAQGLTMYDILRGKPEFPAIVTKMIQTGEKTGTLPKLLIKASDFFEYEVEIAIDGIISLIEPALIVTMGLFIGFISVAMFLPIFDLTSAIR